MKSLVMAIAVSAVVSLSGCVYDTADMNLSEFKAYTGDNPGNKDFEEIGPVRGSKSSWVWSSCSDLARAALTDMLESAKAKGGNVVYAVKFAGESGETRDPTCKHMWGMLMIMVPYPASSSVHGIAGKVKDPSAKTTGMIDLYSNPDLGEVARLYLNDMQKSGASP